MHPVAVGITETNLVGALGFEDAGRTIVLDVVADFAPGEQLFISGLGFWSFTAPSLPDQLELEVKNDGGVSAVDDFDVEIRPAGNVTLSSAIDQRFLVGAPKQPAATIYITDADPAPFINIGGAIRINIPAGLFMRWDGTVPNVTLFGPAAPKVNPVPVFESATTVRFDVITNFVAGEWVSISGLYFEQFLAFSPPNNLNLNVGGSGDNDDKFIGIDLAAAVPFFTATALDGRVVLEWLNPLLGDCAFIHVRARDDGGVPTMGDRPVADIPCVNDQKETLLDPSLTNGQLYGYGVFVEDSLGPLVPAIS